MPSNPLPVSVAEECRKASKIFATFVDPVNGLDKVIPSSVLRKAKGFAFLTVVKAGFVLSARAGTGVVIARMADGNWSAPSAIGTAGAGFGFQVGAEMAEFLIILNSRAAVNTFMAAGSLTLGGNMSVAAGPLGRNVEGTGSISSKGGVAAMYSYSRTKGLFGGASVEGSVIVERQDANAKAYGANVSAKQLLSGQIEVPAFAEQLIDTIARRSGNANNWVGEEEEDIQRPEAGKYSFGSQFASGGSDGIGSKSGGGSGSGFVSKLGSMGRSRSGSGNTSSPSSFSRVGDSAGSSGGPSYSTGTHRFDTDFGDEFEREERNKISWDQKDEDKWAAGQQQQRARSSSGSSKLTKSRSGSATFNSPPKKDAWTPSSGRDSFDSLDDERSRYDRPTTNSSSCGRSNDRDLLGDDFDSYERKPAPVRFPASSLKGSQTLYTSSSSSRSKKSPFGDEERPSPTSRTSYSTKPWDSEDEDLMGPTGTTPRATTTRDPFDFSDVDQTFSNTISNGASAASMGMAKPRSRASTIGKGLGQAIALYDFASAEPGDLAFKKNDVIIVLKQEDAEWWTGRIGLKEGIFPQNRVEFHPN
ncbi:DUF500-domain-containing protein [Meredithblackwellia eburnea MCA 4105]